MSQYSHQGAFDLGTSPEDHQRPVAWGDLFFWEFLGFLEGNFRREMEASYTILASSPKPQT